MLCRELWKSKFPKRGEPPLNPDNVGLPKILRRGEGEEAAEGREREREREVQEGAYTKLCPML